MVQISPPNYSLFNSSTGFDSALVETAAQVPFVPMLLFFVWIMVFMGGYQAQMRRRGFAEAPIWSVMASISTFLLTLILSIKEGLVNPVVYGFVIGLMIACGIWFFLSTRE